MNPIVQMLIDALLKEVTAHPEVLEELIHEAVVALVAHVKAANTPA